METNKLEKIFGDIVPPHLCSVAVTEYIRLLQNKIVQLHQENVALKIEIAKTNVTTPLSTTSTETVTIEKTEDDHATLVRDALAKIQMFDGSGIWIPPLDAKEVIIDILVRFCGLTENADYLATRYRRFHDLGREQLAQLTYSDVQNLFQLKLRQALDFCKAAKYVSIYDKLSYLDEDELKDLLAKMNDDPYKYIISRHF